MDQPIVESTTPDPVNQFSIFTENKVGRLADLIRMFSQNGIHVMALTTLDTTDSAILRVIVDDPERARALLEEFDIAYSESPMVAVEVAGEHAVEGVLCALLEAEINIHYIYSFISRPMGKSALAMSLEDPEVAADILTTRNHRVLSQRDISR